MLTSPAERRADQLPTSWERAPLTRLPLFLHVSQRFCLLAWSLFTLKAAASGSAAVSVLRISMPLSVGSSQRVCTSSIQKQSDNLVNLANRTNALCYRVHKTPHLFAQNISLHILCERRMSFLCGKWCLVPNWQSMSCNCNQLIKWTVSWISVCAESEGKKYS